jgi:hypothetical protein
MSTNGEPSVGTPRWVKLFGIILVVIILMFGILQLTNLGGEHGPGRHIPSSGADSGLPSVVHGEIAAKQQRS